MVFLEKSWPKLSVVVPNLNQGAYLEETLLSIINQHYPALELIVIDGGSRDNSVDIINKYEQHIDYWVSEKDKGQSDAINKGFERATGDYIAWMNSDDIYYKNAFIRIFSTPGIADYDFIYGPVCTGSISSESNCVNSNRNGKLSVFNLLHFFYSVDYIIPSQSVFVKRNFVKKNNIQYLDNDCHYCMDMEWYCRIAMHSPKYLKYSEPVSFFRLYGSTKTIAQYNKMQQEAIQIFLNYRKGLSKSKQVKLFNLLFIHRIIHNWAKYPEINLVKLLYVFFKAPREAIADRRFLGLIKRSLFKLVRFRFAAPV